VRALVAACLALLAAGVASAGPRTVVSGVTHRPERVGQCFLSRVKRLATRLEDNGRPVPDSGSAMELADGHYNVSYDQLRGIDRSRPGDPVRLCVTALPRRCPPGDTRGILYRGRNLRTGLGWTASDAEHMCGGA
jgi:hypothetical protein